MLIGPLRDGGPRPLLRLATGGKTVPPPLPSCRAPSGASLAPPPRRPVNQVRGWAGSRELAGSLRCPGPSSAAPRACLPLETLSWRRRGCTCVQARKTRTKDSEREGLPSCLPVAVRLPLKTWPEILRPRGAAAGKSSSAPSPEDTQSSC